MVKCTSCGAGMRFDPLSQMLKCDYCGNSQPVENQKVDNVAADNGMMDDTYAGNQHGYDQNVDATYAGNQPENNQTAYNQEAGDGSFDDNTKYYESHLFTCPNCGGEVMSDDDTAVTFCSFCGSSVMLEGRLVKMIPPSYVVPFKIPKDGIQNAYKSYMKKALFAPKYMQEDSAMDKVRGIYMPYWIYEFSTDTTVSFKGSRSHRWGDYIITDHYDLQVPVQAEYNGAAFDASSSFSDELSEAIAPFNFGTAKKFQEGYLSGFYADTADVQASVYEENAKEAVEDDITCRVYNSKPELRSYGASPSGGEIAGSLQTKAQKMAYFPVWFLGIKHKDRVSYAVMNGQTGKIAADIPIDFKKYLLGSLLLSLPIMGFLDLFLTLKPTALTFIAIVFAVVSMVTASSEMNRIYTRENFWDDWGLLSTHGIPNPEAARAATDAMAQEQKKTNKKAKKVNKYDSVGTGGLFVCFWLLMIGVASEQEELLAFSVLAFVLFVVLYNIGAAGGRKAKSTKQLRKIVIRQPFSEKMGVMWKPITAIVLAGILLLMNFFRIGIYYYDMVYYICDFAIMALVIISYMDVIRLHNKLTLRVPRQFGKRGGDEA